MRTRTKTFSSSERSKLGKTDFVVYLYPSRVDKKKAVRNISEHTGALSTKTEQGVEQQLSSEGGANVDQGQDESVGVLRIASERSNRGFLDNVLGGNFDFVAWGLLHEGPGHAAIDEHSEEGVMQESVDKKDPPLEFTAEQEEQLRDDWEKRVQAE